MIEQLTLDNTTLTYFPGLQQNLFVILQEPVSVEVIFAAQRDPVKCKLIQKVIEEYSESEELITNAIQIAKTGDPDLRMQYSKACKQLDDYYTKLVGGDKNGNN